MSEREQFEAALAEKPEVRFWNTTDAMFWAWQASRAQPAQAGQVLTDDEVQACIPTVTIKGEKPVPMVWLKQADAIKAIRSAEWAVLAKRTQPTDRQIEAACEAVAGALGDAYDCTRVWSAWSYGTMGPEDFSQVSEDSDRVREIALAALGAAGLKVTP